MKCYGCDKSSGVLFPVKLFTVYGPAHEEYPKEPEYIEHLLCPACVKVEIDDWTHL